MPTHRLLFCGQVFIVQLNVFACERPVHEVYDLKGSSYKRAASEREKQAAFVVLKDIDFKSDPNRAIKLAPVRHSLTHSCSSHLLVFVATGACSDYVLCWLVQRAAQSFTAQLSADVRLLEAHNIIDYSVLLGIHFRDREETEPDGAAAHLQMVSETPRGRHTHAQRQPLAELRQRGSNGSLGGSLPRSNSPSVAVCSQACLLSRAVLARESSTVDE